MRSEVASLPSSRKASTGLAAEAAIYSALLSTGCSGVSSDQAPWLIGLGAMVALGLRQYRQSVVRSREVDAFHALPKKSLEDLRQASLKATGLREDQVDLVLKTVLRYGAPPPGSYVTWKGPFKKIAVDLLRLPPIKRHGGTPISDFHTVPFPDEPGIRLSSIYAMPLAYADRIRAWARVHLEMPEKWLAAPEQIASRFDILSLKVALTFQLPIPRAIRLVDAILRRPLNSKKQNGQLFEGEFQSIYADEGSYQLHEKRNLQPAELILQESGFKGRSISWLKEVVTQMAADCRIPIPGDSMNPSPGNRYFSQYADKFTDHDWHAVFRLRDAVWGPWRLPWEEIPDQ